MLPRQRPIRDSGPYRSTISLTSGCQLFLRHVSRFVAESVGEEGFDESCKQQLLDRCMRKSILSGRCCTDVIFVYVDYCTVSAKIGERCSGAVSAWGMMSKSRGGRESKFGQPIFVPITASYSVTELTGDLVIGSERKLKTLDQLETLLVVSFYFTPRDITPRRLGTTEGVHVRTLSPPHRKERACS